MITSLDRLILIFYYKRLNQIFSPGMFGQSLKKNRLVKWADVIHIHWANHGLVDISEIESWGKPVVWTLRDMWGFTGGCHYAFTCRKFEEACGSCPVLQSNDESDISQQMHRKKINSFQASNTIQWVAISTWMKEQAEKSSILRGKKIELVFSGVDTKQFFLEDRTMARNVMSLPLNKKIILVGAGNFKDEYKGYQYITAALNTMSAEILVITFGEGKIDSSEIPQKVINLGIISDKRLLRAVYNSAEIFFAPSIAEAFGKTFAEAQLCGTPVVCFDKTGPADIIEHHQTGYLAEYRNSTDLKDGVDYILTNTLDRKYISERSRRLFSIEESAKRYAEIYSQLMRGKLT